MRVKEERGSSVQSRSALSSISNTSSDGYYLECRKDAQCDCRMCKASISATLDLRSASKPFKPSTKENQPWPPPFPCFSPVPPPRPKKHIHTSSITSPPLKSKLLSLPLLILLLPLALFSALPWAVSFFTQPHLDHDSFATLAQASLARRRLFDRLDFVQRRISRISGAPVVSNCSGYGDDWRLAEDGYLLHSYCDIYTSPLEKVSIWGYTAKTGGILGRSLVDRSFTVLAGRVMEWPEGGAQQYTVHTVGSSWTMRRWAASAILLDGDTWILEYKTTPLSTGFGGIQGARNLLGSGVGRIFSNIKLYIDTVFFIYMRGLDMFSHQALFASRMPPT